MANTPRADKADDKIVAEKAPLIAAPDAGASLEAEMVSVETTGSFMLLDPYSGAEIDSEGVSKVPNTAFVQDKLNSGALKKG